MSVDYSAGVVYGWKLKQGRYDELPDEIKDEYRPTTAEITLSV